MKNMMSALLLLLILMNGNPDLQAQSDQELKEQLEILSKKIESMHHSFDVLNKKIDDVLWMQKLVDVAWVDKVYIYGPPLWKEDNPTAQGATR